MAELKISLKAARANANLTQDEVSRYLHINKATVVNWEKGKTKIDVISLQKLCELYQIPIENIFLAETAK